MKNFPVDYEGKTYWISRSVAVAGFIFRRDDDGNLLVLVNKRGPGCPDNVGKWVCPCGYLDYGETLKQAIVREIHEETGVTIPISILRLVRIDDVPEGRQNVTIEFIADASVLTPECVTLSKEFCEKDEVDEVMWMPVANIDEYEWAFNHDKLIKDFQCYLK